MLGSNGRHGGAHTKFARFIGSRAHDGTFATPSDNDGLPAQRGVIPLLDGSIEGVHVDVYDFAHTDTAVILFPAGRSRIRERFEHLRSRLPDVAETFGQNVRHLRSKAECSREAAEPVSRPTAWQTTNAVASASVSRIRAMWSSATIATVQEFVRQFVRKRRELFGR